MFDFPLSVHLLAHGDIFFYNSVSADKYDVFMSSFLDIIGSYKLLKNSITINAVFCILR